MTYVHKILGLLSESVHRGGVIKFKRGTVIKAGHIELIDGMMPISIRFGVGGPQAPRDVCKWYGCFMSAQSNFYNIRRGTPPPVGDPEMGTYFVPVDAVCNPHSDQIPFWPWHFQPLFAHIFTANLINVESIDGCDPARWFKEASQGIV